jgi:mevalonate kinase
MNWPSFSTRVSGKWVLAGEHSVLRGVCAIALPRGDIGLSLRFEPASDLATHSGDERGFIVEPPDAFDLIQELLDSVADSIEVDGKSFLLPHGKLKIESDIPMGAGLGSSAALCVALTRWMAGPLSLAESDWVEFATQLEHRFHGRSSGMDVAVISAGEAVSFVRGSEVVPLGIKRLPVFTFHDTGLRSRTSDCVLKVEKFKEANPLSGVQVDDAMATASRLAMEGLILFNSGESEQGLFLLSESMRKSQECFYFWGLVPDTVQQLEKQLLAEGALAVKVTGAGGGGMLVALWDVLPKGQIS